MIFTGWVRTETETFVAVAIAFLEHTEVDVGVVFVTIVGVAEGGESVERGQGIEFVVFEFHEDLCSVGRIVVVVGDTETHGFLDVIVGLGSVDVLP